MKNGVKKLMAVALLSAGATVGFAQTDCNPVNDNLKFNHPTTDFVKIPVVCAIEPLDQDLHKAGIAILSMDMAMVAPKDEEAYLGRK